jgi:outer membrane protein OmpA-like peptidoglycan-associated protein
MSREFTMLKSARLPGQLLGLLALTVCFGNAPVQAQSGETLNKEELIKHLECHDDQACQGPPVSRRRGLQLPEGRRGFTFEPFTEEDRKKVDDAAKTGKLPSADLEVYFEYNRADITPAARQVLGPLGQALIDPRLRNGHFVLVGHTDAKGGDDYNQVLSERRAAALKDYLVRTFGIEPNRLVAYGRGKSSLKNPADPFAAENRRVQVINNGAIAGRD